MIGRRKKGRTQRKDEAMRKLELKHVQEVLNRDEGNTMKRYLDKKLGKELKKKLKP